MDEMVKNYLSHHGIKGQKWGVRRYQNKDGSLTSAGRKRYDVGQNGWGTKDESRNPRDNGWGTKDKNKSRLPDGTRYAAGIRKYQNKDGSLTEEGEKRYERDKRENLAKKKDNRIDTSNPDPNRWVKEDLTRAENLARSSNKMVDQLSDLEKKTRPKMDLSQMSDQELREQINRRVLEQNYERLFSDENLDTVSKGRKHVRETLEVAGTVLGLTNTALSIAKAIQELRS